MDRRNIIGKMNIFTHNIILKYGGDIMTKCENCGKDIKLREVKSQIGIFYRGICKYCGWVNEESEGVIVWQK